MKLKPNTQLQGGVYTIVKTLGSGGFGITYLVESGSKKLCVKEFFPGDYYTRGENGIDVRVISERFGHDMMRYRAKFRKEALNIARFNVDNIVRIHDVFDENNTSYYVMDYIDGESLYDIVRNNGAPLSEARALRYIRQAASALSHIHSHNTVHLDIKPNNIMIRRHDDMAMVIDFGLSKHFNEDGTPSSTTPGGFSRGYTPLEMYQTQVERMFLPTTDIYSLGATLYTLLTGAVPPEATEIPLNGLPRMPDTISAATRNAIIRAMQPNPAHRPQTIEEFLTLLNGDEIPDITKVIDEPPVKNGASHDNTSDIETEVEHSDTPAVRKVREAIKSHFAEAGRRGIVIGTNKSEKLITEIFVDGNIFLRICSVANGMGRCSMYAKSQVVLESVTKLVNEGKFAMSLGKEYKYGNNPQQLIQAIGNVVNGLSGRLTEKQIVAKTEVENRGVKLGLDVFLRALLIPGLFALLAVVLIDIDHPSFGAVMCAGPAFIFALIFMSLLMGDRRKNTLKAKIPFLIISLFFLIFIIFGVIDRWMMVLKDYGWGCLEWDLSHEGFFTLAVYGGLSLVYLIITSVIKYSEYKKLSVVTAIISIIAIVIGIFLFGEIYHKDMFTGPYCFLIAPLVLLCFIDRRRITVK